VQTAVIVNDIVEMIGSLAEEWGDSTMDEILVGLGLAPDETGRMLMCALWSAERVERSLVLMTLDGLDAMPQVPAAAWLDGFAIGLALARREADRSAS
jgi:hypothetical protein